MPDNNVIGNRIAQLRKERGMTQEQLAGAVGVTREAVAMYEIGQRVPKDEVKVALSNVLGKTVGAAQAPYMERTDFGVSDEEVKLFDGWSETYDKHGLSWKDWKKLDEYDHNRLSKDHYIHPDKIKKYMLKEGAKHAKEFFDVGYSQENWRQLENDILEQVVKSSYDRKKTEYGKRFSVNMMLGVEKKKKFQVVWSQDVGEDKIRLITTHRIK